MKFLDIAKSQIGVVEEGGNNRGPQIREYLAVTNLSEGNPWCAAFVAWCMKQAGIKDWPMTADTWALKDWAKRNNLLFNTGPPETGDVFLLLDSEGQPKHTGFVLSPGVGVFVALEGNVGGTGKPGDEVYNKNSYKYSECKFIETPKGSETKKIKLFFNKNGFKVVVPFTLEKGEYDVEFLTGELTI